MISRKHNRIKNRHNSIKRISKLSLEYVLSALAAIGFVIISGFVVLLIFGGLRRDEDNGRNNVLKKSDYVGYKLDTVCSALSEMPDIFFADDIEEPNSGAFIDCELYASTIKNYETLYITKYVHTDEKYWNRATSQNEYKYFYIASPLEMAIQQGVYIKEE